MSAPGIIIRIPLEGRPVVQTDCLTSGEEDRLVDWLAGQPAVVRLIDLAVALADDEGSV